MYFKQVVNERCGCALYVIASRQTRGLRPNGPMPGPARTSFRQPQEYTHGAIRFDARGVGRPKVVAVPVSPGPSRPLDATRGAVTLGNLGSAAKAALPDLIAALKDKDGIVRAMAAGSFLLMGSEAKAAVPALLEAAKDKVAEVRKKAIETLEMIDPEAAKQAKQ